MFNKIFLILFSNTVIFSNSFIYTQKNSDDFRKSQNKLKVELRLFQQKYNAEISELQTTIEKNKTCSDSSLVDTKLKFEKELIKVKSELGKNNSTLRKDYNELVASNKSNGNYLLIFGIVALLLLVITLFIGFRLFSLKRKLFRLEEDNHTQKNQITQLTTNSSENLALVLDKIATVTNNNKSEAAPDHSLVIELVKHITTIENNMSRMDPNDRGLARIKRAVENMHNSLKSMDYEITTFIGREIREGEIIEVDLSEPDDSIEMGKKVIFNVIKAEILFQGKQIQRGKVDIKYNPNN
ncbi:MAG: hypothetical protein ACKO7P_05450 [Bacteroidota bacterium]